MQLHFFGFHQHKPRKHVSHIVTDGLEPNEKNFPKRLDAVFLPHMLFHTPLHRFYSVMRNLPFAGKDKRHVHQEQTIPFLSMNIGWNSFHGFHARTSSLSRAALNTDRERRSCGRASLKRNFPAAQNTSVTFVKIWHHWVIDERVYQTVEKVHQQRNIQCDRDNKRFWRNNMNTRHQESWCVQKNVDTQRDHQNSGHFLVDARWRSPSHCFGMSALLLQFYNN